MLGSELIFDYVHLLYDKFHKRNPNWVGSYKDSPDCIKNIKATKTAINKKDNECLQYSVTVALNLEEMGKPAEIITKSQPVLNKYEWEGIHFSSEKDDLKKFGKLM